MRPCYILLCLIVLLFRNSTICSAQSISIDSIITPSSLKELVQTLSADSFQGRLTGSIHAGKAALYISEQFKKAGALRVAGNDGYIMPFLIHDKITAFNVVAALPGHAKAQELVIFSAHYDHIGTKKRTIQNQVVERGQPEKGDNIYNGANDNASGISSLIHLAQYFAQYPQRERTIIFIAFSGEEEGLLGSKHLVQSFDPKVVKAMINMDMIGRPVSSKKRYPYITGHHQSDLREVFNKKLYEVAPQYGEKYFHGDYFIGENLFARSDNYPFSQKGIVAHTIMATAPNDPYYHSLNDEWETLDYPFFTEVVRAIALAATGLVDGSDTP